jgi:hypothetical protein
MFCSQFNDNLQSRRSTRLSPTPAIQTCPPLLVDTDRILACSIAPQCFKPVTRKAREVGQGQGRIEYFKSLPSLPIKALERPHELSLREEFRTFVPEA